MIENNVTGLKWDYEPRYFACGTKGIYYPDFYVYEWESFVEVKGFPSKIGIDKFNYCKNHYKENFFLFNKPILEDLGVI